MIGLLLLCALTAFGQEKPEQQIDWLQELKSRITINGYMQGGYAYSDQGGKTTTFAWQALRWMLENPGTLVTFSTCSLALGSEMTERETQLLTGIISTIREGAGEGGRVESNADGLDWYDIADLYQHNRLEVSLFHDRTTRSRTKIIAARYETARGYSGYVLLDEVGFIRDFKSFYEAIEPVFSRNPDYRLWMATTPPEDDSHYSYELTAYPPGREFEPCARGTWYENESGMPVHRVDAFDAELAGVHLFDSRTRQPVTPAQHRAKALDRVAWDRNYGLVFTQGGVSAVPLVALHQAQLRGKELGCVFAEDELPPDWTANLDPNAETAVGADPATTEKEKSNPFGLAVTQLVDGLYVARLLFRFRSGNPAKCKAILREVVEACDPRALVIDATSERFWAAEVKEELSELTHVERKRHLQDLPRQLGRERDRGPPGRDPSGQGSQGRLPPGPPVQGRLRQHARQRRPPRRRLRRLEELRPRTSHPRRRMRRRGRGRRQPFRGCASREGKPHDGHAPAG